MKKESCIYYFSAKPDSRICENQLSEISDYAKEQGKKISMIYLDGSLKQSEKIEYHKMITESQCYDTVFLRDLFHVNKWTVKCLSDVRVFNINGAADNIGYK